MKGDAIKIRSDAMKGDAMKGDFMKDKGGAMKGDAKPTPTTNYRRFAIGAQVVQPHLVGGTEVEVAIWSIDATLRERIVKSEPI